MAKTIKSIQAIYCKCWKLSKIKPYIMLVCKFHAKKHLKVKA